MSRTERMGLILTKMEKFWVVFLAEAEGGLSQAALIRRLIRKAAVEHGVLSTPYMDSDDLPISEMKDE